MKEIFVILIVIIFAMLVIPLAALSKSPETAVTTANSQYNEPYQNPDKTFELEEIKVLKDDVVTSYSVKDYLFGVIAAEMPALYEREAIKAQAVAAYTFALYRMLGQTDTEYDITADGETAQCFITREEAAARWGEKASEYTKKIDDCIDSVAGYTLIYNNEVIFAAYHAISPGVTNTCLDVWGKEIPYLTSVASDGDKLADNYLSEVTFTTAEIAEKLKNLGEASGEAQNYFKDANATDNGYVKDINFCGKKLTGAQVREALDLRSCNFTVSFADDKFTFTVKGYGHGVGMSQTGANYMAKQGKSYAEILLHYYKGATLQKNQK